MQETLFPVSKNGKQCFQFPKTVNYVSTFQKWKTTGSGWRYAASQIPKYRACVGTARIGPSMARLNPSSQLFSVLPGLPVKRS
jgi:hypothetical protein